MSSSWTTNRDYMRKLESQGKATAGHQEWLDRWRASGSPDSKEGMLSKEQYNVQSAPAGSKLLASAYSGTDAFTQDAQGLVDSLRQGQSNFGADERERSKFVGSGPNIQQLISQNSQQNLQDTTARDYFKANNLTSSIIGEDGAPVYYNLGGFNPDAEAYNRDYELKAKGDIGDYNVVNEIRDTDAFNPKSFMTMALGAALTGGLGAAGAGLGPVASGAIAGAGSGAGTTAFSGGDLNDVLTAAAKGGLSGSLSGYAGGLRGFDAGALTGAGNEAINQAFEGEFDLQDILKQGAVGGGIGALKDVGKDFINQKRNAALLSAIESGEADKIDDALAGTSTIPKVRERAQEYLDFLKKNPEALNLSNTTDVGGLLDKFGISDLSLEPLNNIADAVGSVIPDFALEGLSKLIGPGKSWADMSPDEQAQAVVGLYDPRFDDYITPRGNVNYPGIYPENPTGGPNTFGENVEQLLSSMGSDLGGLLPSTGGGPSLFSAIEDAYDNYQSGVTSLTPVTDQQFQDFMGLNPTASIDDTQELPQVEEEGLTLGGITGQRYGSPQEDYVSLQELEGDENILNENPLASTLPDELPSGGTQELPSQEIVYDPNVQEEEVLTETTPTTTEELTKSTTTAPLQELLARRGAPEDDDELFRLAKIMQIEGLPADLGASVMARIQSLLSGEEGGADVKGDVTAARDKKATTRTQREDVKDSTRRTVKDIEEDAVAAAIKEAIA